MECGTSILLQVREKQTLALLELPDETLRVPHHELTCRVLWRHRPSVKHRSILSNGPHLIGPANRDGLKGLVCAYVEPGTAL